MKVIVTYSDNSSTTFINTVALTDMGQVKGDATAYLLTQRVGNRIDTKGITKPDVTIFSISVVED